MDRSEKQAFITSLREDFSQSGVIVVAHYSGLTVAQITELRRKLREAGASFKVTKNRLACLALEGTGYEGISSLFVGPTGVAYSADPIAAAKAAVAYANTNDKFQIIGGGFGGQKLDAAAVKALATLPSLDELRGTLAGLLQAPATKLATVLQAPAAQLARLASAYANKREAA